MNNVAKTTLKSNKQIRAWQIKGKKKGPSLLIIAGVHGGENAGVQVALELIDYFTKAQDLCGQVTVVPIVNIEGYKKQTRNNPVDKKNINAAGLNGKGRPKNYSISDAIADEILSLGQKHDYTLDLHSGSKNRYLHHVYYADHRDAEMARYFGFPFVVYQIESRKGSENGGPCTEALFSRIRKKGKVAFALETGAGLTPQWEDVKKAYHGILNFCSQVNLLKKKFLDRKTPRNQVFTRDRESLATTVKASRPGTYYLTRNLGEIVEEKEAVGFVFDPRTNRRFKIKNPAGGRLILKRVLTRINPEEVGEETIFRLMPKSNGDK